MIDSTQALQYLKATKASSDGELFRKADQVRKKEVGDIVYLRAIIEFSNYCRKNCLYCGLRKDNHKLKRYRMTEEEIVATAKHARQLGYRTIVMQSGEDIYYDRKRISRIIRIIKKETGLKITLSLGERSKEEYAAWREDGADRYLLRHETANPDLYQKLHPDSYFVKRLQCLQWLGELGYEVGAGFMVGLPGQREEDIAGARRSANPTSGTSPSGAA